MYRPHNPHFNRAPMANRGQLYGPQPRHWTPDHVPNVHSKDSSQSGQAQTSKVPPPALKPYGPEINRWKSSFTVMEENDKTKNTTSEKQSSPDRTRFHLYDPYEAAKSDSEEQPPPERPSDSSKSRNHWDIYDSKRQRLSPEPTPFPSQQTETVSSERGSYSSGGGAANTKDTDYRPQAITLPTAVQLSPPPPLHSYKQASGGYPDCVFTGVDKASPPPRAEGKKEPGRGELVPPKTMISCDLCEVEMSNGQELEEHLDSKTHWDTLEHIQTHNNYDDMAMAFLQDVMLYKSQKSSRAIEDTALQALQEYDHMTKVEMFHCAACGTFVPTSASAVQNHITSQGHMTNTKEFEVRQRHLCLDKAKTMMKELTPQFMTFAKGGSPFEWSGNTNSTS